MISRLLVYLLSCALTIISVSAQDVQRVSYEYSSDAFESTELKSARGELERTARALELDLAARGTSLAAALFRALRSQNNIDLEHSPAEEMHAYLRHPSSAPSDDNMLIRRAGRLYDQATSLRGDGYSVEVDWMNLEARVRIRLP